MRYFIGCLLALAWQISFASDVSTVLISIDGLSNQQLKTFNPPTLSKLAKNGVTAEALLPVYPTKTFPNHLSIVTGTYPANHGIIHNNFYRRDKRKRYDLGDGKKDQSWLFEKPIWILAQEQGIKTASYFWPESEASINGITPEHYFAYDSKTTIDQRLNQVFDWLSLPANKKPKFITTYFSLVDSTNHTYGHYSEQAQKAISTFDKKLGYFIAKLEQKNIKANFVIVSDHGMTKVNKKISVSSLLSYQEELTHRVINGQTQLFIYQNKPEQIKKLVKVLTSKSNGRYVVYTQDSFPKHWQFDVTKKNNHVMPNIIVDCEPGVIFINSDYVAGSTHGYDLAKTKDMEAIFIATGPNFKSGQLDAFSNIHVFALLAKLINVEVPEHLPSNASIFNDIIK